MKNLTSTFLGIKCA
uniref:Uncharacterized protein n=1 Tax=Rhizophora mucronata TaxID=61149 RepID=A0A2P2N151_RHIMU